MNKILNLIYEVVFPMLCNRTSDKKLKNKIENYDPKSPVSQFSNSLSIEDYQKLYADTIRTKNTFEDKAKVNIIGVTITISLITGAIGLFEKINKVYSHGWILWVAFALYVIAVLYMTIAGIQAIRVICNDNIVFCEPMPESGIAFEKMKEQYEESISKNRLQNLIRNNGVFTSYECIRNALLCLLIVLVIAVFPYNTLGNSKKAEHTYNTYTYSANVIDFFEDQNIKSDVIKKIEKHIKKNDSNGIVLIVDEEYDIAIRFMVNDNVIAVLNIEKCIID